MTPARPLAADPLAQPAQTARVVNIANALTLLRLLLVPVFVVLLLANGGHSSGWRIWAFATFAAATITDLIDGDLARSRGLVTDVGKVADPIADKALTGAALIGLSSVDDLAWWVTAVILVRELGVTGLRFFVIRHGVIPASRGGKVKTLLQNIAIGLYVLPLTGWAASTRFWLMGVALVVTVATGADYVVRAMTLRRTSERAAMKRARRDAARKETERKETAGR
jgi:CDP-diacylglycerol--glycerol-3-phosphate 3-phosphatidyltransferase